MIRREGFAARALYVGTDRDLGDQLDAALAERSGWTFRHVFDVETALAVAGEHPTTAAILFVGDKLSFAQAQQFLRGRGEVPTIVVTEQVSPQRLLELLKLGAAECLPRPLNLSRLCLVLDMVTAAARVAPPAANESLSNATPSWHEQLMQQVHAVAGLDTTVLITGETGSGKTRLSRLIHGMSSRRQRPFLALNCGALTEGLLDSELFGHVKGAFTGADRNYEGRLQQCADGTLLLDEVDMLTPAAQVKLLQVVEDRVFQPVGSAQFLPLEARLIIASNRRLEELVAAGEFRADLYYRLHVMALELPPLRERRGEIGELAHKFLAEFSQQHRLDMPELSSQALGLLEGYAWPGNIRELRNVMERALILSAGKTVSPEHLPRNVQTSSMRPPTVDVDPTAATANKLASARFAAERALLLSALERNDNNRSKTALDLGISRVALYKRLRKLQLM